VCGATESDKCCQMLQSTKIAPAATGGVEPEASSAEFVYSVISVIRRRWLIIAVSIFSALILGAAFLTVTPPRFTAHATLIIDSRKTAFPQQSALGDMAVDSAAVDSQIEILKSENIARSVVKDLHLNEDKEFIDPRGLLASMFGLLPDFATNAETKSPNRVSRDAAAVLTGNLSVRRVGLTYVIDVAYQSLSPERAAQVANAIAEAYIVDQLDSKYKATRRASVWLQDRIRELREQASAAERAVVDFKSQNNIVDANGLSMGDQQLSEVNSQLVLARAQTAEAKARLDRINEIVRNEEASHAPVDQLLSKPDAAVADAIKNDVITKLRSQYLDIANREGGLSQKLGENHLAVVSLRDQMGEIRKSIFNELRRIAETFKSDYQIALAREISIQKSLADTITQAQSTSHAAITLHELQSNSQTFRALYDNFLQRYMESVQQQSFPITEARVIGTAEAPLKRSFPTRGLVFTVATAGGLLLAFGFSYLAEIAERGFRTSEQILATLRVDCLAVVPKLVRPEKGRLRNNAPPPERFKPTPNVRIIAPAEGDPLFRTFESPLSRFAEAIRSLKVAADFGATKQNKVLAITSSLPREGKSTIAANFALILARAGKKVVLVDGDLRIPALTRQLAPHANVGLLEVLAGVKEISDAIWTHPATGLKFLPFVSSIRPSHTSDVLSSDSMSQLMRRLRELFDYVVVDLPPLAPVVDVRSTTEFVDSYILVVEWGRTASDLVLRELNSAQRVYHQLLGVVLNKTDLRSMQRYHNGGGGDGDYYHGYGDE
jgi:polysaccharide biosynthesis transport protein